MLPRSFILALMVALGVPAWHAADANAETSSKQSVKLTSGTLLYLTNSNKLVRTSTDSDITHVGLIVNHSDTPYVYEATPAKVRKLALVDYLTEIAELNHERDEPMQVWLLRPLPAYSEKEVTRMKHFLRQQLGRRYSVQSYVRGKPREGVHCAELAASTLSKADRLSFDAPHRNSPAHLVAMLKPYHSPANRVLIKAREPEGSWCERSWKEWLACWDWCQWSCKETWTFCW